MNALSRLKLHDIASRAVLTLAPDTPLAEVIARFAEKHVSSLVVVEDERPVGIVTERDLVRLMCLGPGTGGTVRAVMSAPLLTVPGDMDCASAQVFMAQQGIRHLVLVDARGALGGVVSETDFRRHLGNDLLSLITSLDAVVDQGGKLMAPETRLSVALETMASCHIDHVIVGQHGHAEGIVTERDIPELLRRRLDPQQLTLGEVMHRDLITIGLSASINEAAASLEEGSVRHLVVVDDGQRFVGVLSQHRMLEKLGVALMNQSRSQLEDRMSLVLEATGIGTWEIDHQQERVVPSGALGRMLGMTSVGGLTHFEQLLAQVEPEDRKRALACFDAMLAGSAERFNVDCRVELAPGGRWISLRGKALERDDRGNPLRSAGVGIDITLQKASEDMLRRSEARFRGLMEKVPLAMGYADTSGKVLFTNAHFEFLFGYSHVDLPNIEAWWMRAYPDPEYRAWVKRTWAETLESAAGQGGSLPPQEFRITCRDGRVLLVEVSGIVLSEGFLAIFNDVTEQRRQQSLLEFSNTILSRISTGSALPEILDTIVRGVEARENGVLCSILLLDESGQHLVHGAAPSLPPAYVQAINGVAIGAGVGSCGTAVFEKREVFVADIASDPYWAGFSALALGHGLAACWSSPILASSGEVFGTFAVYWPRARPQVSAGARAHVETATTLAAIAIGNARRNDELRHRIDELRRWQQATLGREGRIIELKREINGLLERLGEAPRYPAVSDGGRK